MIVSRETLLFWVHGVSLTCSILKLNELEIPSIFDRDIPYRNVFDCEFRLLVMVNLCWSYKSCHLETSSYHVFRFQTVTQFYANC